MNSELENVIQSLKIFDTHEHMNKETDYVEKGPDILCDLFENYIPADLRVAGASEEAIKLLLDQGESDLEKRWSGVAAAWTHCQFTGYGEAVRLIARDVYGLDEITPAGLEKVAHKALQLRQPGERLRILRDEGNYDHIQVDDFVWECVPDESGADFFLYDLSWVNFANGDLQLEALLKVTGVEVINFDTLREALAVVFQKYAGCAIAVKTQHAYNRTLLWRERSDAELQPVLDKVLTGHELSLDETLTLGDWCLARGVELAIEHNLPVKIHTGYYAGQGYMPVERIKPGNLCALLIRYPQAHFVLMHIGYPYQQEMIALAKHFPNVWVDMCWSWSIDPYSAADFVRRLIHAAPSNKVFAFGGDTFWPNASVAYSRQMRRWLTFALQGEVTDGYLTEAQAIRLATQFLQDNQRACFDIEGTRAHIKAALA